MKKNKATLYKLHIFLTSSWPNLWVTTTAQRTNRGYNVQYALKPEIVNDVFILHILLQYQSKEVYTAKESIVKMLKMLRGYMFIYSGCDEDFYVYLLFSTLVKRWSLYMNQSVLLGPVGPVGPVGQEKRIGLVDWTILLYKDLLFV